MSLSYQKLVKGAYLLLFVSSSVASYFHPHAILAAGLSLTGLIAHDVVCYLKDKTKVKDFGPEMDKIVASQEELIQKVADIRNDASIGKLAETFRRR